MVKMSEDEIIGTFEHWIEYEKANKDKINKADELIEIQQGLVDLYQKLKRQVKIKNEYLSLIIGIGFDYDGEDGSIEGLKSVIDQLVDYARKAIDNDDKSVIYGIFDDDVKRNVLLEPIEIPEPLEKPFEEIDNHIPRID
jgi:hypothetical protein